MNLMKSRDVHLVRGKMKMPLVNFRLQASGKSDPRLSVGSEGGWPLQLGDGGCKGRRGGCWGSPGDSRLFPPLVCLRERAESFARGSKEDFRAVSWLFALSNVAC